MYVRQMIGFFKKAGADHRIGPHHVALYMSLYQQWCMNNGKTPMNIEHLNLRQVAKIGRTTYHKCMRELHMYGYIWYAPSYSPVLGSFVSLIELEEN